MQRRAPTAIVLVLLVATAAAFVNTQRQKLEPSPLGRIEIDRIASPVCGCDKRTATIRIGLTRRDRVTLDLVASDEERVRRLVDGRRYRARSTVAVEWDGRDDEGQLVPDGTYRPRLTLESGARSFLLPNRIVLDTRRPRIVVTSILPKIVSPDGDGRSDRVIVRYTVDEPAHGILRVDGVRRVYTRFKRLEGTLEWNAKRKGRPLRAGVHRLQAAAEDDAGNVGVGAEVPVTVRYVELARQTIDVTARTRFGVRVTTDARTFRWRFAGRTGSARPGLLVLRAPRAGRYTLFVEANGHGARARVVVRPRQAARARGAAARSPASTTPARGQNR